MSVLINHNIRPDLAYGREKFMELLDTPGFAARSLLLGGPEDYVQFDPKLKPHINFTREHWGEMGVTLPDDDHVIWSTSPAEAIDHPADDVSIYLIDKRWANVLKIRNPDESEPVDAWQAAVERLDDKNHFIQWCVDNDFVIPKTVLAESGDKLDFSDVAQYPVIGKKALGLFGSGNIKFDSEAELRTGLAQLGERFQIQQAVDHPISISAQYVAADGKANLVTATEAHVKGFAHGGTLHPPTYQSRDITEPVAEAATAMGLRGPFNIDGVADRHGNAYNIELNPRPTWGYYAIMAVNRLAETSGQPIENWSAFNMQTKLPDISHSNMRYLRDLAYDGTRGIALISTALMDKRVAPYMEVVFIGTPEEQFELRQDVTDLLLPKWAARQHPEERLAA